MRLEIHRIPEGRLKNYFSEQLTYNHEQDRITPNTAAVIEIPITYYPDKRDHPPHLKSFRDGWRHLLFMLMLSLNYLFLLPGTALVVLGMLMLLILFPGPLHVLGTVFDVHTVIFGMIFALMGMQMIFLGLFAKVFSYTERFSKSEGLFARLLSQFTLESGLAVGGVIGLISFIGDAYVFARCAMSGFGPLGKIRLVIASSTFFLMGIEIVFASFFLSMLGVSRENYIGEYEVKRAQMK